MGYKHFLLNNSKTLNFIIKNNLVDAIIQANEQAINYSKAEGDRYLHSYRYSAVFDLLMKENKNVQLTVEIVNLLEEIIYNWNLNLERVVKDFKKEAKN